MVTLWRWRDQFDTAVNEIRHAFLNRADLVAKDRTEGFTEWSFDMKEAAATVHKYVNYRVDRIESEEDKTKAKELEEKMLQDLAAVKDKVVNGEIHEVKDLPAPTDSKEFPALTEALELADERVKERAAAKQRAKKGHEQQWEFRNRYQSDGPRPTQQSEGHEQHWEFRNRYQRDGTPPSWRRSASPPPERSLAVFHRRLSHRQAQIYGTTQRAFAEGTPF
ncbi:hypothetical protein JCM10213v2_001400 [Rhodosporidiobolus nylandii]